MDIESEAHIKFGRMGDIRLVLEAGSLEGAKDALTKIAVTGLGSEVVHEIVRFVLPVVNTQLDDALSNWIRAVALGVGVLGLIGRRRADRLAELAFTEIASRCSQPPMYGRSPMRALVDSIARDEVPALKPKFRGRLV